MNMVKILLICFTLCMGMTGVKPHMEPQLAWTAEEYGHFLELNPIAGELFKHYKNITDVDLTLPNSRLPSQQDLKCLADVALLMQGLSARNMWALKSKW